KKSTLIAIALLLTSFSSFSQKQELQKISVRKMKSLDSAGWEKTGFFIFNVNQGALSDWSSGGERFLIGINGILNYSLHHQKGKYSKDTYIDIELGAVEASSFRKFRKTTDRFDLTMELDHTTRHKNLYYGLLFNLNTQLLGGHNYAIAEHNKISAFLSPGKFLLAPGIDFKMHKPDSYFSFFISPVTARWVTKIDDDFYGQYKFGVDSAQKVNTEFGAYMTTHFNIAISKTTRYIGRLDLFSNYLRKPGNVDVLMNNLFTVNISNVFAVNILLDMLYDDNIKRRIQLQEIFGLGLKLKL
ncbi:MAG TPA: DUF3078 domain-containing protein, partial [Chitinophagaceae bacterium]|nr:DUF3078 domain-containing protein [Chitinophagaceae bacterium]